MDNDDTLMSFEEWTQAGYRIKKGERSSKRDANGVPQFSIDQVTRPRDALCDAPLPPRRRSQPSDVPNPAGKPLVAGSPYFREHEVPPGAYMRNRLPCMDSMNYFMSSMNPTHQTMRALENRLDSVFEKHHGGQYDDDDW